ncbi:MAG: LysR substrate-binding domain-containing protein [Rhodospirillales bacterium]|nr:LysR substrate-binding domain-containing protein [Rhodospirillales bacterium]
MDVRGSVLVTDPAYARDLALAGVGIAYLFEPLVREDLRAKRLVWLLPEAAITEPGLFVYFPQRSSQVPKLRAFLDTARDVARLP